MKKTDVLIIGGGPAGFSAARTVLSAYPDRKVTVINDSEGTQIPCSIPFVIGGKLRPEDNIYPLKKLSGFGAELLISRVTLIDADRKCVFLSTGESLSFEKLIIATGWVPNRLQTQTLENVEYISTDTNFVKAVIEKINEAENITIIGAGLIGIGVADAIAGSYKGKRVNLIEASPHIAGGLFSEEIESEVKKTLKELQVETFFNEKVKGFIGNSRVTHVELSGGERIKSDLVLVFIGFKPNSRLAIDAGIEVNERGEIVVDSFMRTSNDSILAAGNCAEHICSIDGRRTPAMLASISSSDGRVAGLNVNGPRFQKRGIVPAGVSKVGSTFFGFSGFTEKLCRAKELDFVVGTSSTLDKYPKAMGGKSLNVKLVFSTDGKLYGGEVWGESEHVSSYINLISRMVKSSFTVEKVVSIETVAFPASTPSPLSAPIQTAAINAMEKL